MPLTIYPLSMMPMLCASLSGGGIVREQPPVYRLSFWTEGLSYGHYYKLSGGVGRNLDHVSLGKTVMSSFVYFVVCHPGSWLTLLVQ